MRVETVRIAERDYPVAMDLEAALDPTKATGPRFLEGLGFLLRSDRKKSGLVFCNLTILTKFRSSSFMA